MRNSILCIFFKTVALFLFIFQAATAGIQNIPCTGYNVDIVANGSGTSMSSTTSDVDGASYVLIDATFKPGSSICVTSSVWSGSIATSGTSGLTYTLQSASENNALHLFSGNTGILTLTTPVAASTLYVLGFSGSGNSPVTATVTFTDSSTQVFTGLSVKDWCAGSSPVTSAIYRNGRNSYSSCSAASCPAMFELSLSIATVNQSRKIAYVSFYNGITTAVLNIVAIGGNVITPSSSCTPPTAQPTGISFTPSTSTVTGSFTASSSADSYLIVRCDTNYLTEAPVNGVGYASGSTLGNGTVVAYQSSTTFTDIGLTEGTIYYYFIFAANSNCTSDPLYLTTSPLSNISTTTTVGAVTYTASGTWTCPTGVTSLTSVECRGGGGGGGYGSSTYGGGGGGGGAYTKKTSVAVTPGTQYAVVVGSFGNGGLLTVNSGNGGDGGTSSFGSTVVANGGTGGKCYTTTGGAAGDGGTASSGAGITSYAGGAGAAGTSAQSGGGGGGAGSAGAGGSASGKTGGTGGSAGGGAGGAGTSVSYATGGFGSSYSGGGAGGTGDGGCGNVGTIIVTCPSTTFYPTFTSCASTYTCIGTSVTYTTQYSQSSYTWTISGTLNTDYKITSGSTSSNTVTITWLTAGTKTVTVNYKNTTSYLGAAAAKSITTVTGVIPTVSSVVYDSICTNETATLAATPNTGTINWYSTSTGGSILSTGTSFTTPALTATTIYYVSAYNGCTSSSRTAVTAFVSAKTSTWKGTSSTSWTDAANWSASVPGACTNVIIDSTATYFPIISSSANCNYITFDAATHVYGLDKLTYQKAFVHVNLKRSKWYMLTSPLKGMYSGDYYFQGAPVSYMKLFGTTQANISTFSSTYSVTGSWTTSFSNLTQTLTPGQGFAFEIDSTEWHYPTGKSYYKTDKTILFPKMNSDSSLVTKMVPYSASSGKLLTALASTVTRDATKAYRFAMEDTNNKLTTMSISLSAGLNLIGNPLMSYLDFKKVYADNSSLISAYAYFWDGSSFGSIKTDGTISGASVPGLSTDIPPMKSFIVSATQSGTLSIKLTHFISSGSVVLKSASTEDSLMYIQADNGGEKSSTSILMNMSATNSYDSYDVPKLFSDLKAVPEVYTVADNNALDINEFSELPYTVPLGITASSSETVNLTFTGVESFDGIDVSLINSASGKTQDLKSKNTYSYNYDGSNGEGSLFLEFKSASTNTTGIYETNNAEKVQVLVKNDNQIYVISSSDNLLQDIAVYDPIGRQLIREKNLNQSVISFFIPQESSVCFVRVTTQKGTTVKKILIK